MNEDFKRELTRRIEEGSGDIEGLNRLREMVEHEDAKNFCPPEDRKKWKRALHMGWESRTREKGEDHRALQGENVEEFEMFRNDLEALSQSQLELESSLGRYFLPDFLDRSCKDQGGEIFFPDEPEPGDFVLGEIVHRFKTNDVKFFRALSKYVEKRAEPESESKKTLAGHAAKIAFDLGIQLGRNPTYTEILAAIREAGFVIAPSDESAMMNRYGLSFLEHRGTR